MAFAGNVFRLDYRMDTFSAVQLRFFYAHEEPEIEFEQTTLADYAIFDVFKIFHVCPLNTGRRCHPRRLIWKIKPSVFHW